MTDAWRDMTEPEAERFMLDEPDSKRRELRRAIADRVAEIVGDGTVIDLGCGHARWVSECFTQEQYVGVDCSDELIARARRDNPGYYFYVADIEGPVSNDYFDFAIIKSVLEHVPSLTEARDIYKNALYLAKEVIVTWHMPPHYDATDIIQVNCELDNPIFQNRYKEGSFDDEGISVDIERIGKCELWRVTNRRGLCACDGHDCACVDGTGVQGVEQDMSGAVREG